jgi:hypothetical protein
MSLVGLEMKNHFAGEGQQQFNNQSELVELWVDSWSNELVVRHSPAGKNVSMEAEDIVGICHQATTSKDIANWEDFMCAVVTVIFGMSTSMRLS